MFKLQSVKQRKQSLFIQLELLSVRGRVEGGVLGKFILQWPAETAKAGVSISPIQGDKEEGKPGRDGDYFKEGICPNISVK